MCGVFGFISADGNGPDLEQLEEIALTTEGRGRHAHGIAWVDVNGRLRRYKRSGPISENLGCLKHLRHARAVIGHCRYATRGDFRNTVNNHPHHADGGWFVHNGTVFNHQDLILRYRLPVIGHCDSEVLGGLIEEMDGSLLERVKWSVELAEGPAVVLGLWTRPLRLVIVRRGKPLHIAQRKDGNVYFGSLTDGLTDPGRILDNTIRTMTVNNETIFQTIEEIEPCRKRKKEKDPPLGRPLRRSSLFQNAP